MAGRLKWYLFLFASAFLFNSFVETNGQPSILPTNADKPLGPVKSLEYYRTSFWMVDGKPTTRERRLWRSVRFDRLGRETESSQFDPKGILIDKRVYLYDSTNKLKSYRSYSPRASSPQLDCFQDYLFGYDTNGRLVEYKATDCSGGIAVRFTYEYDLVGNLTEETWFTYLGYVGGKTVSAYEPSKRRKIQTSYNSNGEQIWKIIEDRDPTGNTIWQQRYRGALLKFEISWKYDQKGRILEETTREFNADPNISVTHEPEPGRIIYRYDEAINLVESSYYGATGSLVRLSIRKLDVKGNEIEVAIFRSDSQEELLELHSYDDIYKPGSPYRGSLSGRRLTEYEYDKFGNWISKRSLLRTAANSAPILYEIEEREIEFY